jgi:hypothetical protein
MAKDSVDEIELAPDKNVTIGADRYRIDIIYVFLRE